MVSPLFFPSSGHFVTGMQTETGGWDTSKALVRRTLEKCIHLGREHRSHGRKEDLYEAYRLLGQAVCGKFYSILSQVD